MATWDGSYHNSEDPNYFLYANQNASNSNADEWAYFSGNGSNTYAQNIRDVYPQNETMIFERNDPGAYYRVSSEIATIPPVPSDVLPLGNAYRRPLLSNNTDSVNASNNVQCFPENTNSLPNVPYLYCENSNYSRQINMGNNAENGRHTLMQKSDLAKHSNLHATANEFVPNGTKSEEKKNDYRNEYPGTSGNVYNIHYQGCRSDGPVSDNRNKYDKRHDKKNPNYKQREQDNRSQKTTVFKNSHRTQNPRNYTRFPNDRYSNEKLQFARIYNESYEATRNELASTSSDISNMQGDSNLIMSEENVQQRSSRSNPNTSKKSMAQNSIEKDSMDNPQMEERYRKSNGYYNDSNYRRRNGKPAQSDASFRNTKKPLPSNRQEKYEKYESGYRGKKNNYQSNNGFKENYDKQGKPEKSKEKDKAKDTVEGNKELDTGNWRQTTENTEHRNNGAHNKRWQYKKHDTDDDVNQRERLTEQLNRGQLECLVCCEYIKQNDYIWSCSNCYHVLHLKCIKKWATSSQVENGWRCPACQNVSSAIPEEYFCFCGKVKTPEWNRRDTAHSCGEICSKIRSKSNCTHKCTLLCHPGSCPPCIAMVTKNCGCGRTSRILQCGITTLLNCDSVCGKELNCKMHTCEKQCHHGECEPCDTVLVQECHCGKNTREVICNFGFCRTYCCGNICDKLLECQNHKCDKICHEGPCEPCSLTPDKVATCYCGQTPLDVKRDNCLDPISTCDKICSKRLKCGQPSNPHTCKAKCHEGDCPLCELTTDVKCRCGNMDREIACKDLTTKADDARCEWRCTKKRSCGKHKCNQLCCIDIEHICPLPCSKTLSCGRHKCEQTCHKGRCQPCWRSSFEELYCECGTAVIYPPVPCGTRRPTCTKPCSREHPCGHAVLHDCHSEPTCPPCTVLTQKWCHGKHELRKAVPCYVEELSCGLPCNKPLSCGRHKCITICHSGPCEKPGQQCVQPCTKSRELCEHICAAPCHEGKCPDTPCKEIVKVTCQCGHRSTTRACAENSKEYQKIASNILASKMADMQLGHSVDLEEVFGQGAKKQNQLKTLECNDECKLIERNRRLALGLQIVNPDLSGKLMPRYSDYMKQWAKKDPHFCQMVHEKLTELVQLAKTSKQKSRSYSFESMNREKRHFVHESCEHFGCESHAYDQEPKRNVVATAVKDKCWLPSYSLLEIVQRENGQRKVPGPMLNATSKSSNSTKAVFSALPVKKKTLPGPSRSRSPEPEIDYFDYHGYDIK